MFLNKSYLIAIILPSNSLGCGFSSSFSYECITVSFQYMTGVQLVLKNRYFKLTILQSTEVGLHISKTYILCVFVRVCYRYVSLHRHCNL